ncbi:kinesin-like protein KIN-12D isoform X3 [Physcomitrium patens]|uniref:Kinesin motor domain-containing protein n=1 Tax=Physcomitrium patens TaxID=3218 RepID=A0A7I4FJB5_PHYPA|nr:kinesin-like protein KIN-12D isoform X3 [Physcomitrium patens]XP_024367558.1 kinesin-like protein KIN-12D isoform X3 [Physcomitrium patens]|eukprot:XP_024367557.1 kinesin-like protein KIN-12D isoform X3 [Physcomitrella patens]
MTMVAKTTRTFKYAIGASSSGPLGLRAPSTMGCGSPKHNPRESGLELINHFSDTASSASSTCSDLSIPSCASSSLYSGFTTSSKMGSDTESASSTPRTTPSKNIPRPGKHAQGNCTSKVLSISNSVVSLQQSAPAFELQEDPEFWNDHNVQVLVRVRPVSASEVSGQGFSRCVRQDGPHTITWLGQPQTRFSFDHVAGESITQEDLFRVAGTPMVENCMRGYNSCMFAYGQTGSGKTHTMLGDIDDLAIRPSLQRGMTPRVFEYLFARIQQEENLREQEQLRFVCKCSFLEIYNEHITDLLDPTSINLQIREDVKTGVYVENLKEVEVKSVHDVVQLLTQGASNRKVAATNMNRESSRSHSVFACTVESKWQANSLTNIRFGRLNLVDLAGSERQKSSGAEGDRLKEAANINKSLSTLGLVIMTLVDIANGKQRHVPYRDSKLTFLLQDSLGGNSKTTVIATISPSNGNALETMSTLKFAQRAKLIKNSAHINEDSSGDVSALRREIQQLKEEINHLKCQNVSAILPLEGDHPNVVAANPAPTISSNNLLLKIRAIEATLTSALRREQQAQLAAKRYATEIDQLQTLIQQRDQNTQSSRMILRFRDEKIRRLEAVVGGKLPVDHYLIEENKKLAEELDLVRLQVERNPELTRFAMENIRLLEQLRGFQKFYEHGERATIMEDIGNLRDQLLEMTETKLALEQGAMALSSAQADKYRKELEICCNDLSTCLEINSALTRQVEQLKSQVAQLSARCQEQQQDLDFLKAQPMGRLEELELERSVHLQIIEDLKAQLQHQQKESEELKRIAREEDVKNVVQDKYTVHQAQAEVQVQVQREVSVNPEPEPYAEAFTTDQGSLFDEDIEQISVCNVKQAAMETEFETFSELMRAKASLLDEDLEKLDVCTKRQSLESEFEAYSGALEEKKAYLSEEFVRQRVAAKTLEMAAHFEPFTELMEGEENLLRESLEQKCPDADAGISSMLDKSSSTKSPANGHCKDLGTTPEPETVPLQGSHTNSEIPATSPMVSEPQEVVLLATSQVKSDVEARPALLEMSDISPGESVLSPEPQVVSISEDVSPQQLAVDILVTTEESTSARDIKQNLSVPNSSQVGLDTRTTGDVEAMSMGSDREQSHLTDINAAHEEDHVGVRSDTAEMITDVEILKQHMVDKAHTVLDGDTTRTEESLKSD